MCVCVNAVREHCVPEAVNPQTPSATTLRTGRRPSTSIYSNLLILSLPPYAYLWRWMASDVGGGRSVTPQRPLSEDVAQALGKKKREEWERERGEAERRSARNIRAGSSHEARSVKRSEKIR